jgi:FAD/FMN-containing dehydrogenase/ubiquinone/menaquinone biosynthesis C-methylase UbiE
VVLELTRPETNTLDWTRVDALEAQILGDILVPGDDDYDAARIVANAAIDRRPAIIVRPAREADVQAAVEFAVANDLPLSVRSGGHAVSGAAIVEGGVTIDLRSMKAIHVDPELRIATAETGLNWAEFNAETQKYGLTVPSGKLSLIGVGGSTLGGGLGWLARKHGLTIDHIRSARVVLADGSIVTASPAKNPDLYWAIRGGGGNFGIVTSFEFDLVPVSTVYGGLLAFPLPLAGKAFRVYRDVIATAPDELTSVAALLTGPDGSRMIAFAAAFIGPAAEGERLVRPLTEIGTPVMAAMGETTYGGLLKMFEDGASGQMGLRLRSGFVDGLDDDLIDTLIAQFATAPPAHCVVIINHLGGAMGRIAPDATAFPHRNETLALEMVGGWHGDLYAAETQQWVLDLWQAVQPHVNGAVPVSFLDDEGPARVKAAYGQNWDRLVDVKRRYDPTNLFRSNQNIPPAEEKRKGTYVFDNSYEIAHERLQLLESAADPGTFRVLETIGIGSGWHCLEVGAGAGSVAAWLSERVGSTGHVLATDIDPRFLKPLAVDRLNLEVRRHDVVTDELPASTYDLIHARMVLEHIPDREVALRRLAAALSPGGWLVVESVDFAAETVDPAVGSFYAELFSRAREARFRMMAEHGFDLTYARGLVRRFRSLGLIDIANEGRTYLWPGGTTGAEVSRLSLEHVRDRLVGGGYLTNTEIDELQTMYADPRFASTSPLVMAVWGRRPE